MKRKLLLLLAIIFVSFSAKSQTSHDDLGAWYQYFWNTKFRESKFGIKGDVQYRNWQIIGDFQQFILRGGINYKATSNLGFTLGYSYFSSGEYGESTQTVSENRIFQDMDLSQKIGNRIYISHRFRLEERWIEDQDFRTRFRYLFAINIPLNSQTIQKNTVYLSAFDEVFLNGQKDIGNHQKVKIFDRNWLYAGIGYALKDNFKFQLGFLNQATPSADNNNLVLTIHHSF